MSGGSFQKRKTLNLSTVTYVCERQEKGTTIPGDLPLMKAQNCTTTLKGDKARKEGESQT
jgi:hypothetical protein